MDFPREIGENPYRHPTVKPHHFDIENVRSRCQRTFEIFLASKAVADQWLHPEDIGTEGGLWNNELLVGRHQQNAEKDISQNLLELAVNVRVLEDTLKGNSHFAKRLSQMRSYHGTMMAWFIGEGREDMRELCNKIIHAQDIRPEYDESAEVDEGTIWALNGLVLLSGERGKSQWQVQFDALEFLEAVFEMTTWVSPFLEQDYEPESDD